MVAHAQEVDDRDAAEALHGARIFVARSSFPTPADDEYYWVDLIGLEVVNREGLGLGSVGTAGHRAAQRAGHRMPRARQDAERLIPFVSAYVDGVDLAARRITVDWGPTTDPAGPPAMRFDVITLFPELFAPHLARA